jgi:hypothetical protein
MGDLWMSTVLILSIALLLVALAASVTLWMRSGEALPGLCAALFCLIAAAQGGMLWSQWDAPFVLNAWAVAGGASLATGAICILVVFSLWRTLAERDGIETLHWNSMEAVRMLNELAADDEADFEEKVSKLLEIGTSRFDLEVGMLARVGKEQYEVIAVSAPEDFRVAPGASYSVDDTICKSTLRTERLLAIEKLSDSSWEDGVEPKAFGYDAYFGIPIHARGSVYGTLSFAGFQSREKRFSATDKDLIQLMAQWLGGEIGKRAEAGARTKVSVARHALAPESGHLPPDRAIHANRILRRIESELRSLVGDRIELVLKLDSQLGFATARRTPLDAIVRTLVLNARDAMPEGGSIVIETANLEVTSGKSDIIPAVAPDRYVTLSVRDSGSEPDADQLSQLYEIAPRDAEQSPDGAQRLSLAAIYRMLQAGGGDLSVDVAPGHGSTFTVYLPRANPRAPSPRKRARTPDLSAQASVN